MKNKKFRIQFLWMMSQVGWIKVNTDGMARGCPRYVRCGGIFKSNKGEYIDNFFLSLVFKMLYMLRLWESFWLLRYHGLVVIDLFGQK